MITFLSSLGSRSTIARRISSSSVLESLRRGAQHLPQLRVVAVLGQQLARAGGVVGGTSVFGGQLGRRLELAVGARGGREALSVADHRRVGELRLEALEARIDLVYKFIKHRRVEFRWPSGTAIR